MLLRHETTPGYARLARRRQRRRRITERVASSIVAIGLIGTVAAAAIAQPGVPTTFALGIGLVLYVLASFGLEEPPRVSKRSERHRPVTPEGSRRVDGVDWARLDDDVAD